MFKVYNRYTRTRCEIFSELTTINTSEWHHSRHFTPCSIVSIVDFEQVNTEGAALFSITLRIDQKLLLWAPFTKNIKRKVDLEPCEIAMIEIFNSWMPLTIFTESSIPDV